MKRLLLLVVVAVIGPSIAFSKIPFSIKSKKVLNTGERYLMNPQWSPDGLSMAVAGDGYGSIWLYSFPKQKWEMLVEQKGTGFDFDWSPDSRFIAFRSTTRVKGQKLTTISAVNIYRKNVIQVTESGQNFSTPKWITNTEVAFLQHEEFKTVRLSPENSPKNPTNTIIKSVCLFSAKGYQIKLPQQSLEQLEVLKGRTFCVSFSPDNTRLLYQKLGKRIFVADVNGQNPREIARGDNPCWSPDGRCVVYVQSRDDGHRQISADLFICDIDGSEHINLTNSADELEMRPHWSAKNWHIVCDSRGKIIILEIERE